MRRLPRRHHLLHDDVKRPVQPRYLTHSIPPPSFISWGRIRMCARRLSKPNRNGVTCQVRLEEFLDFFAANS
jgi:hypothetical protein